MIWFVTGKPGDGKSYAATAMILEHLKGEDPRPVVTNILLDKKSVAVWLVSKGGLHPVRALHRAEHRIHYLPDDELQEFYRHRADVYVDPEKDRVMKNRKFPVPDFSLSTTGVVYYLDEVHIAFPARNWQGNGDNVVFYNSQHRKLSDDVFFITQSVEMVDKIFRELAQGTWHCRNMYRLKFGMFRHKGSFKRSLVYDVIKPRKGIVYSETREYPLDPLVGACFQTMSGVGLKTTNKPELQKVKGVPLKALWFVIPFAFFGVIFGMGNLNRLFSTYFSSALSGQAATAQKTIRPLPSVPSSSAAVVGLPPSSSGVLKPYPVAVNSLRRVVEFSDGTTKPLEWCVVTVRYPWAMADGVRVPVVAH